MSLWEICKIAIGIAVVAGTVFYFTKSLKRLVQVTTGLAAYEASNVLFDIGLWPIIQNLFGAQGAIGMTIAALVLNLILLKWYQKIQIDWLGITITDDILNKGVEIRNAYQVSSGLKKVKLALPAFGLWLAEKAITIRIIPFLVLSATHDSFVATAFHLHRKNGTVNTEMKKVDYLVFLISTVFSCGVWTLFTEVITIPGFKNVWHTFFG